MTGTVSMIVPVLWACLVQVGDDETNAPPKIPRERAACQLAFGAYQKAYGEYREAMSAHRARRKDADIRKRFEATQLARVAALETLRVAFLKTEWSQWDPEADAKLLQTALPEVARVAREDGNPTLAIRAYELTLKHFPTGHLGDGARRELPRAFAELGRLDEARARTRSFIAEATVSSLETRLLLLLGDLHCVAGDLGEAMTAYGRAGALLEVDLKSKDKRTHFRAQRLKGIVDLRLQLVGKPAPGIDTPHWLDADPAPLSARKGRVVVVDFFATWNESCRKGMSKLDDLRRRHGAAGLDVVGVTHPFNYGYFPDEGGKSGRRVTGIVESEFAGYLKTFKERMGIAYPFAIVTKADFRKYFVPRPPTVVVLDRRGRVAYVGFDAGGHGMLTRAVERLLAEKPDAPGG